MSATVLTVDLVVLAHDDGWHLLLVRRGKDPFAGRWALPGGKVGAGEGATAAARRELEEETGLRATATDLVPLTWRTAPDRDPRGRYVSLVHAVLLPQRQQVRGGDDAAAAWWQPLPVPPYGFPDAGAERHLAFDHAAILREVLPAAPPDRSAVPRVRAATEADSREIRRLWQAHAPAGGTVGVPTTHPADGPGRRTLVAALGGFLVGCTGAPHGSGPAAEGPALVRPRWQGRGIEQQLAAAQAKESPPR
ncbi:NUDIX domain-containing protein [Streptomyces sp. NPDC018019]|uniref:NUDIX domain-containing protein n=1 Tax=Streptomyces sp. NPDC018019 TaxID=3365030 RepID=UPI0037BD2060